MNGEAGGGETALPNPIEARREQAFPRLTPAQIVRLEAHGKRMRTRRGEVLAEPGERHRGLFVILSGSVEIVRPGMAGEVPIVVHTPGQFSGEMSSLRGVASVVRARVREAGEILAIDDEKLRAILQTDSELSDILMRAFILRRVGLIASQSGDVILIGSSHSADTLRLQQFLTRNAFPYVSIDVERDPTVQALLDRFHVSVDDIPVVLCRGAIPATPRCNTSTSKKNRGRSRSCRYWISITRLAHRADTRRRVTVLTAVRGRRAAFRNVDRGTALVAAKFVDPTKPPA